MFQRAFFDDLEGFRNLTTDEGGMDRMEKFDDGISMPYESPFPFFGAHRS